MKKERKNLKENELNTVSGGRTVGIDQIDYCVEHPEKQQVQIIGSADSGNLEKMPMIDLQKAIETTKLL